MYDVAVIGAGIIGCLIARELSRYDLRTVVIEKSSDVSNGSTKANSGIVHAGYDALEGTLKAKLNVEGNKKYEELCRELEVPFARTGSLVLAFSMEELGVLDRLYERGIKNGVEALEIIERDKIERLEPNVSEKALYALHAKTAGIVSPYELCVALGENAVENGVEFRLSTRVEKIFKEREGFVIETNKGTVHSQFLVNAAGLFSDDINNMLGGECFKIIPRRGEYCLIDKTAGKLVSSVIFQAPSPRGKGILVSPTTHGNLLIGPNAIEIPDKENLETTIEGIEEIIRGARNSVNNINTRDIIASFTGVRATPEGKDFIINLPCRRAVNAGGIESPGLTAAPAIGRMVLELLCEEGLKLSEKKAFNATRKGTRKFINMKEEEKLEALKRNPLFGRVICRCEQITEGDIVEVLQRPLGPRNLDGIKRRLRAGMGRCQGGFCMPRVVEILARELCISPEEVLKADEGSYILTGRTK